MSFSFLVFSDFHYKQHMYATTVEDLHCILRRARAANVDMILHAGDFCNDFPGSPEVTELLMHNPQGLPVYGCYGNHDLETAGTAMTYVSPRMTNREVVWGTPDGRLGDCAIGHYYFDFQSYRFVMIDTNYSLNPAGFWERNHTGSYCQPKGNILRDAMGPEQVRWLEEVLTAAANEGRRCIVVGHAALNEREDACPDHESVRAVFARVNALRKGTVQLVINGHHHTDNCTVIDDVIYLDVNSVRNAWWAEEYHGKYTDEFPTFPCVEYDDEGKPLGPATQRPFLSLRQGKHTLFTADPLSAIVTVDGNTVTVEGTTSRWVEDLAPNTDRTDIVPLIRNRVVRLN